MIPLWTWHAYYSESASIPVAWADVLDAVEMSKIDTEVTTMYACDPNVLMVKRANRDTLGEFTLLDRRQGGLYSQWIGASLGAPIETAFTQTVGGPVLLVGGIR